MWAAIKYLWNYALWQNVLWSIMKHVWSFPACPVNLDHLYMKIVN